MTLPLPPVHDYGDPPSLDPGAVQFAFDQLSKLFLDTGGRSLKIRAGTDTVTYPGASATSNAKTVNHGLGSTPIAVLLTESSAGVGGGYIFVTAAPTSTAFTAQITSPGVTPALNTTQTFYWLAIG